MNVFEWLREHDVLAWIGLALGVVGVLTAPVVGWSPAALVGFLAIGVVAGGLLVAFIARPPKHPFTCIECVKTYTMTGVRGAASSNQERMILRARLPKQDMFMYAKGRVDGVASNDRFLYRNRGKSLKAQPQAYVTLNAAAGVFHAPAIDGTTEISIKPPVPIARGEFVEILREYDSANSFPGNVEFVGKGMLWPANGLSFKLEFNGSKVTDCQGMRYDHAQLAVSAVTLTPLNSPTGSQIVEWNAGAVSHGERCRVTWRWQ